jgi:mono/diheme cytochrome c family protein
VTRARAVALAGLLALAPAVGAAGCDFVRGYAEGRSQRLAELEGSHAGTAQMGLLRFVFDDLGGLNTDTLRTNALPWKVAATTLVLEDTAAGGRLDRAALNRTLQRFGFFVPRTVLNWSGGPPPAFDAPLGFVTGYVGRRLPSFTIETANLGCAACHAGVLYDAAGRPTGDAWLGLPNTSLDLEAYTRTVYQSMRAGVRDEARLLDAIPRLFPSVTPDELETIRHYLLPRIRDRLGRLERTLGGPTPFGNGGPGRTNGVGSLKLQLGILPPDRPVAELGYTSIPDLGGVALRSSLLYDGLYAPPGATRFQPVKEADVNGDHLARLAAITAFFTVPTLGVTPEAARRAIPRVEEIWRFVAAYRGPPFPGSIDRGQAERGRALYHAACADCHGTYSAGVDDVRLLVFPNRLTAQAEMGTDPGRWQAITPELVRAIERSGYGHAVPLVTGGYVASRLSALWATAPYLHNGSVPTLWHLMHPDQRPRRFEVGGHRLDFAMVGIAGVLDGDGTWRYPAGYVPWAAPELYDTAQPGLSNAGHEREFARLSEAEKTDLLEYLKLL